MSNEAEVFGNLMPAQKDLFPIIEEMREKYNIPVITSEDTTFLDILFSSELIDWDAVKKEVDEKVRSAPNLIPEEQMKVYKLFEDDDPEPIELRNRNDVPDDIRKSMMDAYAAFRSILFPMKAAVEEVYKTLSDRVIEYLMTGRTRPLPEGWFGTVDTMSLFGNKTVVAMAGQLGDPKEISSMFRSLYTKTFGRDHPEFTKENIDTARSLSLQLGGMILRDITDIYIERHPEEFPPDMKETKRIYETNKLKDRLRKRMQRLQADIYKLTA